MDMGWRRGRLGGDSSVQKLFIRPFGPRALATYVAEASAASPPVYGVSREDADRMDLSSVKSKAPSAASGC